MPEEWSIGVRRPSTISDWKKLIADFRDQFPYDPLTALIVETFANSLDAKGTNVDIYVSEDTYKISDNGKGMTQSEFEEYHNIASLTKRRGEGIGFAGVGAKTFLDRSDYIITETKSRTFHGATKWAFYRGTLEWEPIVPQNRVQHPTGTFVEVKLKETKDIEQLKPQFVRDTLRQYYNAVLLGYYSVRKVTINGENIEAWQVPTSDIEKEKELDVRFGGHRIRGFFVKSKKALPDEFQGPFIVVYGKTVMQWWFKQYPVMSETFTGLILADYLIDILRTSKSDFDRTSMLWKKFHAKIGKLFSDWLDEIGAKPSPPSVSPDVDRLVEELEKSINEILKTPEFTDLANSIFQNITQRIVGIRSMSGTISGTEVEGGQLTSGTIGGRGEGEGIETLGDDEGRGTIEDENGTAPIERVRRRVRGGIKIGLDYQPENLLEGWIDPGRQVITINMGHPAYKVAEGLSIQMRAEHVVVYHILRTVVNTMVEEVGSEEPKEAMAKILSRWYEHNISGRT